MNHGKSMCCISMVALLSVVGLSGCTVMSHGSFPDVGSQTQIQIGTIQGSNFGGHAPLVGAHVYLLQTSTSGYGTLATSQLSPTYTGTNYPTTENVSDPNIPTTGTGTPWYYETTDSTGAFNITGDYTCTSGLPVYLYAYGGTPTTSGLSTGAVASFSPVTAASAGSTLMFTSTTSPTAGEQVVLSGFPSAYSYLNGQGGVVLSAGLTATTFEVGGLTGAGSLTAGTTYTAPGTVQLNSSFNPGVVNLLMLGVCPSSGSFSTGGTLFNGSTFTPLNYVYVNEVSTVAAAYAMAGFGTDGLHIGTDTSNAPTLTAPGIIGIQNAAMNAGNLYDIQGLYLSTVAVGEGHIANPTTFSGSQNGTVPQAELDTLGNILATCVDSNNLTGSQSPQCATLFSGASSNGGNTGGTNATNTATAAFNIAHYPMTSNVLSLYTTSTGTVPFTPNLTSTGAGKPNDFTVGILYSSAAGAGGASATTSLASPTGIAIDSYGNAYISASTSSSASDLTKLSPLGTALAKASSIAGSTVGGYLDFVAVDQLGNVWGTTLGSVGGQSGTGALYKFNSGLTTVSAAYTNVLNAPTAIAIDSGNNLYITQENSFGGTFKGINVSGGYLALLTNASSYTLNQAGPTSCLIGATSITVDASSYLWVGENASNNYCKLKIVAAANGQSLPTAPSTFIGSVANTYNFSLDSSNNGWISAHNQTNLYQVTSGGTSTAYGHPASGTYQNDNLGGLNDPGWSAIDGSGNIFIVNDNGTHSSVSEFNNTGTPLSCPNATTTCPTQGGGQYGFQPGNVSSITGAGLNGLHTGYIAIDPSGDVWVANYVGNSVLEMIGVGSPVVTPLSSQKYGTMP